MGELPTPADRVHVHTRRLHFECYSRTDGLWDIEGELRDTKAYALDTYDGVHLAPGEAIHHMKIRMTIDDDLHVRGVEVVMVAAPFAQCQGAVPPVQGLVGACLGKGWRNAIEEQLGKVKGCTHLRELLFNMATAAYQAVPHYNEFVRGVIPVDDGKPPAHLGTCMSWDFNGPAVRRIAPRFFGYRKVEDQAK